MSQHANDLGAERSLLGGMMQAPQTALAAFMAVPPEAYYNVRHQVIASLIRDMVARRIDVDPVTVYAEACRQGIAGSIGDAVYLHTLISVVPTAVNADYYAEWLCELYGRRRLVDEMTKQIQQLDQIWENGDTTGAADAVLRLRAACDEVISYSGCATSGHVTYLDEFLAQEHTYDWLVPGLLERMDRLVLTGDEGFGKSELAAQVACCLAAGVHPFTGELVTGEPLRILVLDCENSQGQSRRRYHRMVRAVNATRAMHTAEPLDWRKHLAIEFRTDGMSLTSGADVAYVERLVTAVTPDVLVIGPLYKLHGEDEDKATAIRSVVAALDGVRARHGCAIITEAHSGHAKGDDGLRLMRPRGSALLLGWPEFGLGLRRNKDDPDNTADVVAWRGHRDERMWPIRLFKARSGRLPWMPTEEYYEMQEPDWDAR